MKLKIAMCQMGSVWGDKGANMRRAEEFITSAADADVVVFPEMFTTGFDVRAAALAEGMDGETVGWFRRVAAAADKAVAGSALIREDGKVYNRFLFATPDGKIEWYDKRHLFSFGGEHNHFAPGARRTVIEYKGFRIRPLICYDLRFPVWSRGAGDVDVMIYVAAWDASRIGAWDAMLRARAIENQCYVVGVNQAGADPDGIYPGHSVAIGYFGEIIAAVPGESEGMAVAELDREPLDAYRAKFQAWRDADTFQIL